jgi:hypothetical protein
MLLTSFLHAMATTPALQLAGVLIPIAILLDVLCGALNALKHHSFSFRMLGDFARHDLAAFVMILFAAMGMVATGMSIPLALGAETGALGVLFVGILTSLGTHLEDLTGLPVAFWEVALQNFFLRVEKVTLGPASALPPMDFTDHATQPTTVVADTPATNNTAPASGSTPSAPTI